MGMLYLVRHGQSTANLDRICSGSIAYNIGLSKQGTAQAEALGKAQSELKLDLLVTSRLLRAKNTADAITWSLKHKPTMRTENSAFDERSLGTVEGISISEVISKYGHDRYNSWFSTIEAAPPNGESMFQLYNRVVPFFIKEVEPLLYDNNYTIMMVTHMSVMQVLSTYIEQVDLKEFTAYSFDNCAIVGYNFELE